MTAAAVWAPGMAVVGLRPTVPVDDAQRQRWQDLAVHSSAVADAGTGEWFTETVPADDYPGDPQVHAELTAYDTRLQELRRLRSAPTHPAHPAARPEGLDALAARPHQEAAFAAARTWARDVRAGRLPGRPGMLLHGPVGSGKTVIATAALASCGRPHRAAGHRSLERAVNDEIAAREPRRHADALARHPLLLLDDVGASRPHEHILDTLRAVIEQRHDARLPTIVTSNLPLTRGDGSLRGYLGERTYSRLVALCQPVPVIGPDQRLPPPTEDRR